MISFTAHFPRAVLQSYDIASGMDAASPARRGGRQDRRRNAGNVRAIRRERGEKRHAFGPRYAGSMSYCLEKLI
jgi:hypothetical protein